MYGTPEERFCDKVAFGPGCWEWKASLRPNGYGQFGWALGDIRYAHRVAWEFTHDSIPQGMQVLHRCDNPRCVNPAHLFLGTPRDNMLDKVAKGRQRGGARLGQPRRRISDQHIMEIRVRAQCGAPYRVLARKYNTSAAYVRRIAKGLARVS